MLIGNYPVADEIGDDDILIISKDGVHLLQVTVRQAGFGGGLKWWIETEEEIYREYESSDLGYASLVKVLPGTEWETYAYRFMDTYYHPDIFPQVCMMADKIELAQPKNEMNGIMALSTRETETVDDCGPMVCTEDRNTYIYYENANQYYTGFVNVGSNRGVQVKTTCQKSNNYPAIAVAGCKMYCISDEHLIKNFPHFVDPHYARYTNWGIPGAFASRAVGDPRTGTPYANGELNSLGEHYMSDFILGEWNPVPLEKHINRKFQHPMREGWLEPNEWNHYNTVYAVTDGKSNICLHSNSTDAFTPGVIYNTLKNMSWQRGGTDYSGLVQAFKGNFAMSVPDIIAAATDDTSAAIHAILEANNLWQLDTGWSPKPMSEWWAGTEEDSSCFQYTVTIEISSPFAYATEHEEPVLVCCNTYGYEPDPPQVELNVNDFTREEEYGYYDQSAHLPYGSNIIPLSTWSIYPDPIHDPDNMRIDKAHAGSDRGYWGYWTNDTENNTGLYDVNVTMPVAFNRLKGGVAWDVTMVPITRNWFDRGSNDKAYNRDGYFDTEYGQLSYHFSIVDHEGVAHTYPDCVYQSNPSSTHGYNYLAFDHPYEYDTYTYRYDTKEPDSRILQNICAGTYNELTSELEYDYSIGDHWIFNKDFLEANLEEHIFVDFDEYDIEETLYDDDYTHETPIPDKKRTYHIRNLIIRKGYTSKIDTGERAMRRARKCFDEFLNTSGIRIVYPKVTPDGSNPKITTGIGIEEDAFFTGYVDVDENETTGETTRRRTDLFRVDRSSGNVDTKGSYFIRGKNIRDMFQEHLEAGDGIKLESDGLGTTTITNTALDVALDIFIDKLKGSPGIIVSATTDPETAEESVNWYLNHDIIGVTAQTIHDHFNDDPNIIAVNAVRTDYPQTNARVDELYLDKSNLGIRQYIADNGIDLTDNPSTNTLRIKSTALDNIRVNGVKQQKVFDLDPPPGEDGDGYYVDLEITPGGGGVEYKIPTPMLDFANKSAEITSTNVEGSILLTAPTDGVLYCYDRRSNYHYINVIVDGTFTFTFGNMFGKTNTYDDISNMLPLSKGQVVTLGTKSVSIGGSGYPQFYFIPYVTTTSESSEFVLPSVDYSEPVTSFNANSLPYDGTRYIFTPTVDGVLCNTPSYSSWRNPGAVYIIPLDDNEQPLGTFYLANVPGNTSSTSEYGWQVQFPVQKDKKYGIVRSDRNACSGMPFYLFAYETVSKADDVIFAPYLDFDSAEVIHMQSGTTSAYSAITPPTITDKPGILISVAEPSGNTSSRAHKIKVSDTYNGEQYVSNNCILLTSRLETDCVHRYITVPAYEDYAWKVYGDQAFWVEEDLIFIPFADYSPPGVDRIVANGKSLVKDRICDLSELYNKIADLEARVEALENPT